MKMRVCISIFVFLISSCADSPTDSNQVAPSKFVVDHFEVTVTSLRVDFTFYYHFQGKPGVWTAFYMYVVNTGMARLPVLTNPYPVDEPQVFQHAFPLLSPLTVGDSAWVWYQYSGLFYEGSDTSGSFVYSDSIRTVVR